MAVAVPCRGWRVVAAVPVALAGHMPLDLFTRPPPGCEWFASPEGQVLHVKDRLVEQLRDVRIVQAVDDLLAAALADHEPELAQRPQLVRDGGRLHADRLGQRADRARALLQAPEDLHAARTGEHLHALGDRARQLSVDRRWGGMSVDSVTHPYR